METPHEIKGFQNTIVRLFSLLHCCALQQTTVREVDFHKRGTYGQGYLGFAKMYLELLELCWSFCCS